MRLETLVITQDDLNELIRLHGRHELMDLVIERLQEAFLLAHQEGTITPARAGVRRCPGGTGVLEWMPHHDSGRCLTLKTVAYTPANPTSRSLPTILAALTRFDDTSGHLTAVCDGVLPTAVRTGAASAVASRLLARPDSGTVGLIGAGAQSVTQLHALARVFRLSQVLVHDSNPVHCASFAERTAFLGLNVRVAAPQEIEEAADIICTATSVPVDGGPVLEATHLTPHAHINAVGADLPGKTELPLDLLRSATVVPDHLEQARKEGECQRLSMAEIGPDLPSLLASPMRARALRSQRTVFDSTGYALEDHAVLDVLLELADKYDIGERVQLEHLPTDALNPYGA
ncbi:ornithine cyclodeaminase family protein [Streptomyces sp. NPDC017940]|uniref:ornithine cyclodeaminase family protein n=1 Tax=Streptomyces sp. NPDC017940 TaxID=3365017 RepID=UPI003796F05D